MSHRVRFVVLLPCDWITGSSWENATSYDGRGGHSHTSRSSFVGKVMCWQSTYTMVQTTTDRNDTPIHFKDGHGIAIHGSVERKVAIVASRACVRDRISRTISKNRIFSIRHQGPITCCSWQIRSDRQRTFGRLQLAYKWWIASSCEATAVSEGEVRREGRSHDAAVQ